MNTFKRYLCFFGIIGILIIIVGLCLLSHDEKLFNWKFIPFFIIAVCIYVFPMSYLLSNQASVLELRINKNDKDVIKAIDSISFNKCNRKEKYVHNNEVTYSMKNFLGKWLTNPIKATFFNDYIMLSVPKAYEKYFNIL